MKPHVLDHRDHRRSLGLNRYVYAVRSRRAGGVSVGINLNPDGGCGFRCVYCQVDRRGRQAAPVQVEGIEAELDALLREVASGALWSRPPFDTVPAEARRVVDLALAGDGEPTACRVFAEVVDVVVELRRRHGLEALVPRLFTNGTLLHLPRVRRAVDRLRAAGGEVWAKLDAGDEETFRAVNRAGVPLARVLANLHDLAARGPLVIQAMFFARDGVPPAAAAVEAWSQRIRELDEPGGRLQEVQVLTVARPPAEAGVTPLAEPALQEIADRVRTAGIPVTVHPAPVEPP